MAVATDRMEMELFDHDHTVDGNDWYAVRLLQEELEEELAEQRTHLLRRVGVWQTLLHIFRRVESRKLVLAEPTQRDLAYHRAFLRSLIGTGEVLTLALRQHTRIDPKHIGLTVEDMEAAVEDLRYSDREWHGDMRDARRQEVLRDVFAL